MIASVQGNFPFGGVAVSFIVHGCLRMSAVFVFYVYLILSTCHNCVLVLFRYMDKRLQRKCTSLIHVVCLHGLALYQIASVVQSIVNSTPVQHGFH